MLFFRSSSTRVANSRRAMTECFELAYGRGLAEDCSVLIFHASVGHDFQALAQEASRLAPNALVLGASCCGIVGREGVSESMHDLAIMAIEGSPQELAVAKVDGVNGANSLEMGQELGRRLREQCEAITMVNFLGPGIDVNCDGFLRGLEAELGESTTIFGATASDNMRGLVNYQSVGSQVMEAGAWAIGFADPSLKVTTQATHGFIPIGQPLVATRVDGNRILELNGKPAWPEFLSHLGLPADATTGDSIPIGALAEELPAEPAEEYGNSHILRVVTRRDEDGSMHYPVGIAEGTPLWLTKRDEERIFQCLDQMMEELGSRVRPDQVVAVFHADCLARGRKMLGAILKEEIVRRMQAPLSEGGVVPPWLGMYGFGEFARLGAANEFHNYTTSLAVLHRVT